MHPEETEVLEKPLSAQALAQRWRALVEDPRYADLVGKLELDSWGRITMTPVSTLHADFAGRLTALLMNALGGHALPEVGVQTAQNVYAPDVAWCSAAFWGEHKDETPLSRAPELCVEIASPSNARRDLDRKVQAYLGAGAVEAWILFPRSKRIEFFDGSGRIDKTAFKVELTGLFD